MKKFSTFFSIIVVLFVLQPYSSLAQSQQNSPRRFKQALYDELKAMAKTDQFAAYKLYTPEGKNLMSPARRETYKDSVFRTHKKRLEAIFNQYGYPGYDLVHKNGEANFWLMVQHCDFAPVFQQKILKAMLTQVQQGNAGRKHYALLTDRVRINTGKKQLFGTQIQYDLSIGKPYPKPLEDEANVDKRRKKIGLEPLNKYLNDISEIHFTMNKQLYLKKGIKKPYKYPLTTYKK